MLSDQNETEMYLPISVAAEQLGCNARNVCELAEKGVVGFIRMPGNRIVISEESVRSLTSQIDQEPC